ncbi:sulfotransferase family 2 domain-containing protein [Palleronia sediminis]|nr:sulfotransferase family 2 domain-containing protein [Palleronia sediminis]
MTGILYIHVPKCGGSSFGAALRLAHPLSQATIDLRAARSEALGRDAALTGRALIRADYEARDRQLHRLLRAGRRCIAGHVRASAELLDGPARGHRAVTLLRDPVARFVSHYAYLMRRHPDPDRPATLEAFLETDDAMRLGSTYLFYFGGTWQGAGHDIAPAMAAARKTLSRFALIGDLSRPRAFAADLRRLCRRPVPILTRNAAPPSAPPPPSLRPRIEEICAPDIALYRYATGLEHAA